MSSKGRRPTTDEALMLLSSAVELNDEAICIAQGWSILPPRAQRHVKILIDDYIAKLSPALGLLYANASGPDQLRFNEIVERIQAEKRGMPPAPEEG